MNNKITVIDRVNQKEYSFMPMRTTTDNDKTIYVTNHVHLKNRVGRPIGKKSSYKHKLFQYKVKINDFEKTYPTLTRASEDEHLISLGLNYTTLLNVSRNTIKHKYPDYEWNGEQIVVKRNVTGKSDGSNSL